MTQKVLLVGHLVAPPTVLHASTRTRCALRLLTRDTQGSREQTVTVGPELSDIALSCCPGELLYVEGRFARRHRPDGSTDVPAPAVAARHLVVLSKLRTTSRRQPQSGAGYTAIIRWQSDVDPSWELETHHAGFDSAERAALFAGGYGHAAAARLRLATGKGLRLTLTDGAHVRIEPASVIVWRRMLGPGQPATTDDDDDFHRLELDLAVLAETLGADGDFTALHFHLSGPCAESLDVSIEAAGERAAPRVRVTDVRRIGLPVPVAAVR